MDQEIDKVRMIGDAQGAVGDGLKTCAMIAEKRVAAAAEVVNERTFC